MKIIYKVIFWLFMIVWFIPSRIMQSILAYYFKGRGYKYVKNKDGFYYWTK